MKILVVEDNPGDFYLIRDVLLDVNNVRFELTHVFILADAMKKLEEEKFDVILLDLYLPDSHGLETFDEIYRKVSDIPIVIMSGYNDESIAIRAVQKGAQDYLVKGQVNGNILMRSMRYAVERKGMEEALRKAYDVLEMRMHERTVELEAKNLIMETLLESLPQYIYWRDRSMAFEGCNTGFAQMLGLEDRNAVTKRNGIDTWQSYFQKNDMNKRDRAVIESGKPVKASSERLLQLDGSPLDLIISRMPIKDINGNVLGVIGIIEQDQ